MEQNKYSNQIKLVSDSLASLITVLSIYFMYATIREIILLTSWREIGRPRSRDTHPRLPRRARRPPIRVPRRSARPLPGLSRETGVRRRYRPTRKIFTTEGRSHFKGLSGVVVAATTAAAAAADRLRVTWLRLLTITPSYHRPQPRDRQDRCSTTRETIDRPSVGASVPYVVV